MSARSALDTFRGYRTPRLRIIEHKRWWAILSGSLVPLSNLHYLNGSDFAMSLPSALLQAAHGLALLAPAAVLTARRVCSRVVPRTTTSSRRSPGFSAGTAASCPRVVAISSLLNPD